MIPADQMVVMLAERLADPGTAAVEACMLRQTIERVRDLLTNIGLDLDDAQGDAAGRAVTGVVVWIDAVLRQELTRIDLRLDEMRT